MDANALSAMTAMLNTDLGDLNPPQAVAEYRRQLCESAVAEIAGRGVTLDLTKVPDLLFAASWAAWRYRKRDGGAALPDMLRAELLSRLTAKSTAAEE